MKCRSIISAVLCGLMSTSLIACGTAETTTQPAEATAEPAETAAAAESELPLIDNAKWSYNEEEDVYYQIGIS